MLSAERQSGRKRFAKGLNTIGVAEGDDLSQGLKLGGGDAGFLEL